MAEQVVIQLTLEQKKALDGLTRFNKKVKDTEKGIKKTSSALDSFVGNLAAIGVSKAVGVLKDVVVGSFAAAASVETLSTQFEVLLGSTEAAEKQLKTLTDFAASTPFQLQDLAKVNAQLISFGITADDSIPILRQLGDAAAASGSNIADLGLIFGQVRAAGKLTGERLLQFQERAIPIGPAIAKTLGIAETSVKDFVSKGKVDFETFAKAFKSLSDEGGQFAGGIEKQSKTLNGVISTLKDNFFLLQVEIGNAFKPVSVEIAQNMTKTLQDLAKSGPAIANTVNKLVELGTFFATGGLGESIADFFQANEAEEAQQKIGGLTNRLKDLEAEYIKIQNNDQGILESLFGNRTTSDVVKDITTIKDKITELQITSQTGENEFISETAIEKGKALLDSLKAKTVETNKGIKENTAAKFDFLRVLEEEQKSIATERDDAEAEAEKFRNDERFARLEANLGKERALKLISETRNLKTADDFAKARKKLRDAEMASAKNGLSSLFSFEKNTNAGRAANFKSTLSTIATLQSSNNKTLFAIGKASALATGTIDGIAAVQKALASAPPPFNFVLAGLVGTASALNLAKIASAKPPSFEQGGIVPGNSFSGDKVTANVNSGELILNTAQQNIIADKLDSKMGDIVIQIDGREIARAVRDQQLGGFQLAT